MLPPGSQGSHGRVPGWKGSSQREQLGASLPVAMLAEASVGWSPLAKRQTFVLLKQNTSIWKRSLMKPSSDVKFSSTWVAGAVPSHPSSITPLGQAVLPVPFSATDRCSDFTSVLHSSKLGGQMHSDFPYLRNCSLQRIKHLYSLKKWLQHNQRISGNFSFLWHLMEQKLLFCCASAQNYNTDLWLCSHCFSLLRVPTWFLIRPSKNKLQDTK